MFTSIANLLLCQRLFFVPLVAAASTTAKAAAPVVATPAAVTVTPKAVAATTPVAVVAAAPVAVNSIKAVTPDATPTPTPAAAFTPSTSSSSSFIISTVHSPSIVNVASSTNTVVNSISGSPQVVPVGTDASSSNTGTDVSSGPKAFPIAAIAVIAIIGGVIFIFASYKIYVWSYRRSRRNQEPSNPYPEARPLAGNHNNSNGNGGGVGGINSAGSRMSMAFGNGTGEGGFGSVWHACKRNSTMGYGTGNEMWANGSSVSNLEKTYGASQEKEGVYDDLGLPGDRHSRSGSHTPVGYHSREGSPFGREVGNSSRENSTSEFGAGTGAAYDRRSIGTFPSRNSMISSPQSQRRSLYGSSYNGPQVRSVSATSRLSGAPHAPHSRIDIVPPLPLGPPPGATMATDKSTIQFSSLSGIGGGLQSEDWFINSAGQRQSVLMSGEGIPNPHFDGSHDPSRNSSQHSFPPQFISLPRGRDPRANYTNSPPYSNNGSTSQIFQQNTTTESDHSNSSPSSSSSRLPHFSQPPNHRQNLPQINTNPSAFQPVASSPLEKLQQRMVQEAHRDAKARERIDRVKRANDGDDGTSHSSGSGGPFADNGASNSSASGSRSGGDDRATSLDAGNFRSPTAHLEEISAPRQG